MGDLTTFFDEATGLYNVYKWCHNNQIPKELFNLILAYFKTYPKCIHCSIGCCKYNKYEYRYQDNTWIRNQNHKNNDIPLRELVGSLIRQLKKDPDNQSIIGKIILLSFTKYESGQILLLIEYFLDRLPVMCYHLKVNDKIYPMKILDFGYEMLF